MRVRPSHAVIAALGSACLACEGAYPRGAVLAPPSTAGVALRCLDVAVYPFESSDPDAPTGAVDVTYRVGNGCDEVASFAPRVRARYGGRWVDVVARRGTPAELQVDAYARTRFTIHYAPPPGAADSLRRTTSFTDEVCVQASPQNDAPPVCTGVSAPRYEPPGSELVAPWPIDLSPSVGSSVHVLPVHGAISNGVFRFPDVPFGSVTAWTFDVTPFGTFGWGRFYASLVSLDVGAHGEPWTPIGPTGLGATVGGPALFLAGGPVVGARLARWKRWGLDAEALSGIRAVWFDDNFDALDPADAPRQCVHKKNGVRVNDCSDLRLTQGLVEPRLVVDGWLTPWIAVSAWGGADVVPFPYGGWSAGATLSWHLRSFGEAR